MNEKKNNVKVIEQDSSKKQIRNALIVLAIIEAIVTIALIIHKVSR